MPSRLVMVDELEQRNLLERRDKPELGYLTRFTETAGAAPRFAEMCPSLDGLLKWPHCARTSRMRLIDHVESRVRRYTQRGDLKGRRPS